MHKRTFISNATLVNDGRSFRGGLVIEDDRIEEVLAEGETPAIPAENFVDATGAWLLPGVIDTHVHFRDPGLTHKADFESESRAAAAGGVTSVFDMPNCVPQTVSRERLAEKLAIAAEKSHVNYAFYIGATTDNLHELRHFDVRKAAGIKLFMGASTGNMLVGDDNVLRQIFCEARVPVVAHCEDSKRIAERMEQIRSAHGDDAPVALHSEARDAEACYRSTEKAVALAHETGARLHVAHLSTRRELALFGKDERITAEVCLPHLLFTEDDYARLGARIKCNPAIKTADDRQALRDALSTAAVTTIGTDHAPHLLAEKRGNLFSAASGIPMIQYALPSMLELVDNGVLSIERLVELMCHNPARLFNVENRGFLREGAKADLVLVRRDRPWTLTPNRIQSRCNWSPLEGHVFRWRVDQTYCNGFLIYNRDHITDERAHGEALTFDRP